VAWIAGDVGELRSGTEPAIDDPAFRTAAEEANAEAIVSALAEPGQPVRFHRWLFALDGALPNLAGLRETLRDTLHEPMRNQLPVQRDAGLVLALLLHRLQTQAPAAPPDAQWLRLVVAQALEQITDAVSEAWSSEVPPLGLVLTNGELLVAVRRGGALRWSTVTHGGVRVSSRVSPDTKGWDALGPESIMSVTPDGTMETEALEAAAARQRPPDHRPPRRFGS
jgi:hypothetical protein